MPWTMVWFDELAGDRARWVRGRTWLAMQRKMRVATRELSNARPLAIDGNEYRRRRRSR